MLIDLQPVNMIKISPDQFTDLQTNYLEHVGYHGNKSPIRK